MPQNTGSGSSGSPSGSQSGSQGSQSGGQFGSQGGSQSGSQFGGTGSGMPGNQSGQGQNQSKEDLKAVLARANVEIVHSMSCIDHMSDNEISRLKGSLSNIAEFFDFNGSCGSTAMVNRGEQLARNLQR